MEIEEVEELLSGEKIRQENKDILRRSRKLLNLLLREEIEDVEEHFSAVEIKKENKNILRRLRNLLNLL